jgi:hypothetical protein
VEPLEFFARSLKHYNKMVVPHSTAIMDIWFPPTACFREKSKEPYPAALRREGFGILMLFENKKR